MGVVISKPAINIREQLTELKAQQGYEERQFHFDNLVTNGTFDTDTDWTKGTGWTISGGVATKAAGLSSVLEQLDAVPSSGLVSVTFDATRTAGVLYVRAGGNTNQASVSASGSYEFILDAQGVDTKLRFVADGSFAGTIDNISVYEVDPSDNKVIHTMPKGWKPLHVFEDGALQREGSAYDYTVEYDGFNYIVKETVAPVASSSITVIGVRA